MTFHYFKNYIKYLFCSRHWRGYGVHSPFAFELVTRVIEEDLPYYKYGLVERVRKSQKMSKRPLVVDGRESQLRDLVAGNVDPAYAQLLFRLVNRYKARNVVETNMRTGIASMYLAAPDSKVKVTTFGNEKALNELALHYMKETGFRNVRVVQGTAEEKLQEVMGELDTLDLLFVNDCASGSDLDDRIGVCMPKTASQTIFVVEGIYANESMTASWKRLQADSRVRVTVDLFRYGLVFFKDNLQKEDYYVRFFPDFHL